MYGGTRYFSLSGSQPEVFGDYMTDWTTGTSIFGLTGTGRLGLVALSSGASTSSMCRVRTNAMGAFDSTKYARISFEAVVAFDTIATVTDDYFLEIGLVGNKWAAADDDLGQVRGFGHFFRYQRSVGGVKWIAVTSVAIRVSTTSSSGRSSCHWSGD